MSNQQQESYFSMKRRIERQIEKYNQDFDSYTIELAQHIVNGRAVVRDAQNLHDRAITSICIAELYLEANKLDNAIINVNGAIRDLDNAIKICKKSQPKPTKSIVKYSEFLKTCRSHKRTLQDDLSSIEESKTPETGSLASEDENETPPPKRARRIDPGDISPQPKRITRQLKRNPHRFNLFQNYDSDSNESSSLQSSSSQSSSLANNPSSSENFWSILNLS